MKNLFTKKKFGILLLISAYELAAYVICEYIIHGTKKVGVGRLMHNRAGGKLSMYYSGGYKDVEVFNEDLFIAFNLFLIVVVLALIGINLIRKTKS